MNRCERSMSDNFKKSQNKFFTFFDFKQNKIEWFFNRLLYYSLNARKTGFCFAEG